MCQNTPQVLMIIPRVIKTQDKGSDDYFQMTTAHNSLIFISHASADKEAVALTDFLMHLFKLDTSDIVCTSSPGNGLCNGAESYPEIESQIRNSEVVIFLLSQAYCESDDCKMETSWGYQHPGRFIIHLEDVRSLNKPRLLATQSMNNWDRIGIAALAEHVKERLNKVCSLQSWEREIGKLDFSKNHPDDEITAAPVVQQSSIKNRHDLVDTMVEKIRQSCQSVQNPTGTVRDMFVRMVRCLTLANASQSLDEAMEFLIGHKWTSRYGSLSDVRSQLGLATNDYSAAGSAYYKVSPRRAEELGMEAVEVQNEVWDELSCDERMVLVLYGTTRRCYRIEDQSNELYGTGVEFSLLVGPHPWSKQFDILRVAYRLLADGSRDIADIIVEEHARCQAEKARTGRL